MKIVSLNTWKCDHHYTERLALMSEQLSHLKPDVVFLQEAFKSGLEFDTAGDIAAELNMYLSYLAGRRKHRNLSGISMLSESGLAILSQIKPEAEGYIALPSDPEDGDRWAQWIVITTDNARLLLINTHLSHLPDREDLRKIQLEAILNLSIELPEREIFILGGDMNAELDDRSIQFLIESNCSCHWQGLPVNTLNIGPEKSIDHLFLSPQSQASWESSSVVLDNPDSRGLYPSDHKAVCAHLVITP